MKYINPKKNSFYQVGDITVEDNHVILTMKDDRIQFCISDRCFQERIFKDYTSLSTVLNSSNSFRKVPKTNPETK